MRILSMRKMGRVYQTICKMPKMSAYEILQQGVSEERLGLSPPLVCCCHTVALDIHTIEMIRMSLWQWAEFIIIMSSSGSFFRLIAWCSRFDTSDRSKSKSFLRTARGDDGRTNWSSDRSERISFVKPTCLHLRTPPVADFPWPFSH
jgi:hypothetical protein